MSESGSGDRTVVFVNRFTVHGPKELFENAFSESAAFLRERPGLIQYTLLRHAERPDSYINIARWSDEASFRSAIGHPGFPAHARALRELCTTEPGLYTEREVFRQTE
ncbi:antibiotic biosynthesis monooxygenase family protein [Streptomyces cyaneofuscatus]|uniref:antibiotic biosynthesis monooxygenase family protein n=1 Tax=Streptomyces cyaneofuscatus TaxID=66883 RepID=UPI0033BDCE46